MTIRRTRLAFEDQYTQIPNTWLRDGRLTLKARGLLAQIMSHRVGWEVSLRSLAATNPEGLDALRAAVAELVDHGYLVVDQTRTPEGKFAGASYDIVDPFDPAASGEPSSDNPMTGEPTPKKNIQKKNISRDALEGFEEWYSVYPKKKDRAAAERAWKTLLKAKALPEGLLAITQRFADQNRETDPQYLPYPATWLNKRRWEDVEDVPAGVVADESPAYRAWKAQQEQNGADA